jgi:putative tributyrin esterase
MAWLRVHYHSETLGMPVPMEVLIPQTSSRDLLTYPTLYLLHDMGDNHSSWLRKTSLERYAEDPSLAIVMPAGHLSYYTDMSYGKAYFTFITEELPFICERMFPLSTSKDDRFIAGNGIGGFGALNAALSASSHIYSKAASFSSPIDIHGIVAKMNDEDVLNTFGKKEELKGSANDLYAAVTSLLKSKQDLPEIYLFSDEGDIFFKENESFEQYLASKGVPVRFDRSQTGYKGWKQSDYTLDKFFTLLSLHNASIARKGE